MKKILAPTLLIIFLCSTALAGDVPFPPVPPVPPCTENCIRSVTVSPIPPIIIDLVLSLIALRP